MQTRVSRLVLELILAVSVLTFARLSPSSILVDQTSVIMSPRIPKLTRRPVYQDLWHYMEQWIDWLTRRLPETPQTDWGSFTSRVAPAEALPTANAAVIMRVQGAARGTATSGSSISAMLSQTPTSGNLLIAVVGTQSNSPGDTVSSISETNVSWTKQISTDGSGWDSEIWAGIVGSNASTSITVNLSSALAGAVTGAIVDICEYSGLLTSGYLDRTTTNSGNSVLGTTGTTTTITQATELWVGTIWVATHGTVTQSSPTNGFTLLDGAQIGLAGGAGWDGSLSYLESIVSTTGAASGGTSWSSSSNYRASIATFEALSGPPANDFSISASPTSQTIGAGGTASSTLAVTAGSGFSGTVNLNVSSGCPSGVTCSISPSSISTSGIATLSVPTQITTIGTYSVIVTATSGSLSHPVTFTITVTMPPSFNFNVQSTNTQVVVTVTWAGTGTASVIIAAPNGTQYLESGAVVYNRISYVSGTSTPTNIHRVTFTLSNPPAGVWTAYVSISGANVTIEVS